MTKKRLTILHLANSISDRGNGIINVATDLAIEQARVGTEVLFASSGGGFATMLEKAGVRHIRAPQTGTGYMVGNSLRLLSILRRYKPDIIHTHMRNGLLLVAPWAKLFRVPMCMHLHNIHDRDYGLSRLPDRIIAVSTSVREMLIAKGVPADRVIVVANGVLGTKRRPAASLPAVLQRPALVTVAGMMLRKGVADLIAAFNHLCEEWPDLHLYLVGGGSEQAHFEKLAAATKGSSRIHFEGYQSDPRPYLQSSDVFVLASHRESFGLAVLEARAAGCAIVASNVDGIPELLEFGRCGLLSVPSQPAELARNIDLLLRDPVLNRNFRERAGQKLDVYTVEHMAEQIRAVYETMLR